MIEKTIHVFTEKQEALVSLLVRIGTTKNIARVLVYLANLKNATAREIERGTDLSQPAVSIGLKYLAGRGWVKSRQVHPEKKGRPIKIWNLTTPVSKILDILGNEKREDLKSRVEMIQWVRSFT